MIPDICAEARNTYRPSKRDPYDILRQKTDEATKRRTLHQEKEAAKPQQMFLPGMHEFVRAMPNQLARSSLYAPIANGSRKFHQEMPLVSRLDAVMSYTGEQLDEADADLSMQLIYQARPHPLGQPVRYKRAPLLRAMARSTGKNDYAWLHRRMKALTVATLVIEAKRTDGSTKYKIGDTKAFHILADFEYSESTETYTYTLDPRWRSLFDNREFALIDWNKRLQIGRGQNMAKALQRLLATSAESVQRYALDWLKAKMQYASPMRKFRESLTAALLELQRLEIIATGQIQISTKGKEQLTVWLPASG